LPFIHCVELLWHKSNGRTDLVEMQEMVAALSAEMFQFSASFAISFSLLPSDVDVLIGLILSS